jgi:hypothetical protein
MIEIKGSSSSKLEFFITKNEWKVAAAYPERYVVQFWGSIDLRRPMGAEYPALRSAGYPIELPSLIQLIDAGVLDAHPNEWRVSRGKRNRDIL